MPDWALHLIVPLLALLIVSRREDQKYILLLLPLAVLPDFDTLVSYHRVLLHNIFIPLFLLFLGWMLKEKRAIFNIAAVYIASHVFMDMFGGGIVLFYPFYNKVAFVDASLQVNSTNALIWTFNYGFSEYDSASKLAYGYISDSIGTGALALVLLAGMCAAYMDRVKE